LAGVPAVNSALRQAGSSCSQRRKNDGYATRRRHTLPYFPVQASSIDRCSRGVQSGRVSRSAGSAFMHDRREAAADDSGESEPFFGEIMLNRKRIN
jgi:hypothetical protein